jgi:hypothetical protein
MHPHTHTCKEYNTHPIESTTHGPLPEPPPSAATPVQTPTITIRKMTQKSNCVTRSHPSTTQTSLDDFAIQHPVVVDNQINEEAITRPQSKHLDDTWIIEIQPPNSDKKHPSLISALPKKRVRIAWSTITSRPLTPSSEAPTITQTIPIVAAITQDSPITATTDQAPTIITCASSQKRKRPFKGKPWRSIDRIGSTSNQNPLAATTQNYLGVQIIGFTLCLELQETNFSFQNECTQFAAKSSMLPDDFVPPMSVNDIQIIIEAVTGLLQWMPINPRSYYKTFVIDAHQSWKLLHNCYDKSLLISEAVIIDSTSPVVMRLLQHLLIRMLAHDVDEGEFKIWY